MIESAIIAGGIAVIGFATTIAIKKSLMYRRYKMLTRTQKAIDACVDEMYSHSLDNEGTLYKYELQIRMPNILVNSDAEFLGGWAQTSYAQYGYPESLCDVGVVRLPDCPDLDCVARWQVVSTTDEDAISSVKSRALSQGILNGEV